MLFRSVPKPPNFLYDVKRFCHKVFAQLEALKEHDQFYWLDADVEMVEAPPLELLEEILGKSFVSFLGRNTYSETGVIAFNGKHPDFDEFISRYGDCYNKWLIFNLPYWTDCHAFDWARSGGGNNLTPVGFGVDNVLPDSSLGRYMVHHKGRLKLQMEEQSE